MNTTTLQQTRLRPIFEVTAAGFDGSTDATDDLVAWIEAENAEQVTSCMQNFCAKFCGQIDIPDEDRDNPGVIDFKLPSDNEKFVSFLAVSLFKTL